MLQLLHKKTSVRCFHPILFNYVHYVKRFFTVTCNNFNQSKTKVKMSVNVYKNRVFKIEDFIDVCLKGKAVKLETSSFNEDIKKIKENKKDRIESKAEKQQLENGALIEEKEGKTEEGEDENKFGKKLWKYQTNEIKSVYLFFLINILRFKNKMNVPLLESICYEINNVDNCENNLDLYYHEEDFLNGKTKGISFNLKKFFIDNMKKCKQDDISVSYHGYESVINSNIEKCGILLLYTYKIASCCKFLTCTLFHMFELFNIDCNILFNNNFNNNFNNSNINSINNLISNVKWLIHDSKIAKDKKRSKEFASDIFLFIHFQSKIIDECEYFFNIMNTNFKNLLNEMESNNNHSTTLPLNCFLNIFSKNLSEYLKMHIEGILSIINKIIFFHLENFETFLQKNEIVQWDSRANLRKPPVLGFFFNKYNMKHDDTNDDIKNSKDCKLMGSNKGSELNGSLKTQYLFAIEDFTGRISKINNMQDIKKVKELTDLLNEVTVLLTHINILTNIMHDIESYNAAIKKFKNNKKVATSEYNVGIGVQHFKHFVYSFLAKEAENVTDDVTKNVTEDVKNYSNEEMKNTGNELNNANIDVKNKEHGIQNNSKIEMTEGLINNSLLVTSSLFPFLKKKLKPYKYQQEVDEILTPTNIHFHFKTPKGTKDHDGEHMRLRNLFFDFIKKQYLMNGAVEIDTPVFELKETLTNKYGEDSHLIYDLKDQGGENLSLRYDLTVPLCRFFYTNNLSQIKRFHIGKVYRRDEPNMNKGRFREFYQCDFDIVGKNNKLKADFHILILYTHMLNCLKKTIGSVVCKINHRVILEYILLSSNVKKEKIKTVSSSVDKLDKITFEQFREELINVKGISKEAVDKIEYYVTATRNLSSPYDVLNFLNDDITNRGIFDDIRERALDTLNYMKQIFDLLKSYQIIEQFSFDISLARGLDYYTGIIFEFILLSENNVGSIAAGGRYDELIKNTKGECIPAVGASIGIERIITLAEQFLKQKEETAKQDKKDFVSAKEKEHITYIKGNMVDVLVCISGNEYFNEAVNVCKRLWDNNIGAEFVYAENPKIPKQIVYALEKNIPLIIIIGDEIKDGNVKIKDLTKDKNQSENEIEVKLMDCVETVKTYLKGKLSWKQKMESLLFETPEQKIEA